jgi:inhibitor of cysteine peptidase
MTRTHASLHERGEIEGLHMAELVLTQTQSGRCVSAAPEDVIVIRLAEHPTTGYRWQVENAAGLVLTGDDFTVSSSAPGTGGERAFRFVVQQSGTARIALSLRRPWEAGTAPAARFEVTVEVGRS